MSKNWPKLSLSGVTDDALEEAVAVARREEREFWEEIADEARGALCEVGLAEDLDETGRRSKAMAHYDRIVAKIKERYPDAS